MTQPDVAKFVDRQRRERIAAGLPETITDESALATVAALITSSRVATDDANAQN